MGSSWLGLCGRCSARQHVSVSPFYPVFGMNVTSSVAEYGQNTPPHHGVERAEGLIQQQQQASRPAKGEVLISGCLHASHSCVGMEVFGQQAKNDHTTTAWRGWTARAVLQTSHTMGSSAPKGSSRSSRRGLTARARARAMRCLCPPDSCMGYLWPCPGSFTISSSWFTLPHRARLSCASRQGLQVQRSGFRFGV